MAYDFHYTPTGTGVISGKEVLEQTEDAINDLGNTAISGVQEALDKAEQALTNSENAVDDAQTALNTANNAEGVAIQAQTDVGNLSGTVANIGNRVTTAEGNITNLQGRMTTAEGNITNLQGRMTTAETNIGNLQTAVSTAQATANSAQQTATTARQQSYVFRYSSTALVASSTNSNTLLDNTDNLKVGDKVIDSSGVLFSVTAIDTQNSTFTIGTALIDLAKDSDVVHTSGNETVGGSKTFTWPIVITSYPCVRMYLSDDEWNVQPASAKQSEIRFTDKNAVLISYITFQHRTDANEPFRTCWRQQKMDGTSSYFSVNFNNLGEFYPENYNSIKLGKPNNRWLGVYAMNYYYGANDVEFSTKFVTTDTNQTISGAKTFSDNLTIYNSDNTANTPNLILQSSKIQLGDTSNSDSQGLIFNAGSSFVARVDSFKDGSGTQNLQNTVRTKDTSNNIISVMYRLRLHNTGLAFLESNSDNTISLGRNSVKWKDCQTYLINGLTPSSLSMPSDNLNDIIDISSYLSVLDGSNANTYIAPANGWISITMSNCSGIQAYITGLWGHQIVRPTVGSVRFFMPVLKNKTINILIFGGTIDNARFIPCQGNV